MDIIEAASRQSVNARRRGYWRLFSILTAGLTMTEPHGYDYSPRHDRADHDLTHVRTIARFRGGKGALSRCNTYRSGRRASQRCESQRPSLGCLSHMFSQPMPGWLGTASVSKPYHLEAITTAFVAPE